MKATIEKSVDMFMIRINSNDGLLCDIHVVDAVELNDEIGCFNSAVNKEMTHLLLLNDQYIP